MHFQKNTGLYHRENFEDLEGHDFILWETW